MDFYAYFNFGELNHTILPKMKTNRAVKFSAILNSDNDVLKSKYDDW